MNVKEDTEESPWVKILLLPFRLIAALFKGLGEILGPATKFFLEALRVVVAIAIIVAGLGIIFCLIVLIGVALGMFTGLEGWITVDDLPYQILTGTIPTFGLISLFLCIFVPGLAIGLLGFSLLFKAPITNSYVGWALFALWILGLIGAGLTLPSTIADFRRSGEYSTTKNYDLRGRQAVLKLKEVGMDDYEGVSLTLRGHTDSVYTLVTDFEARGRSRKDAQQNAQMADYNVFLQDSVFTFDSNISFKDDATFRFQEVSMVMYIPENQIFYMDDDLEYILRNTIHRYGYTVRDIEKNQWMFSRGGLECVTCGGSRFRDRKRYEDEDNDREPTKSRDRDEDYGNERLSYDFQDFDELVASSKFDITIVKGPDYKLELKGRERELDEVRVRQFGQTIELDTKDWKTFSLRRRKAIKVNLTMPELNRIKLSGACNLEAAGFSGDEIEIDMSGASDADLEVEYDRIDIEMTGTADLILAGRAEELIADISGTTSLHSIALEALVGDIRTSGVSSAKIFVTSELEVDANGASDVQYKGDPKLDADESRASSIKRY